MAFDPRKLFNDEERMGLMNEFGGRLGSVASGFERALGANKTLLNAQVGQAIAKYAMSNAKAEQSAIGEVRGLRDESQKIFSERFKMAAKAEAEKNKEGPPSTGVGGMQQIPESGGSFMDAPDLSGNPPTNETRSQSQTSEASNSQGRFTTSEVTSVPVQMSFGTTTLPIATNRVSTARQSQQSFRDVKSQSKQFDRQAASIIQGLGMENLGKLGEMFPDATPDELGELLRRFGY